MTARQRRNVNTAPQVVTYTMCSCGENRQISSNPEDTNVFVPHVDTRTGKPCAGLSWQPLPRLQPELDWPGLKATYTKALDYRHICSYDGPVVDCPVCFDETDVELKRRSDR